MKIKMLVILIIGVGFLTSCENDDNSPEVNPIDGLWNLNNIRGGLQGVNLDYNEGQVKWSFNSENSTLIVEKNVMTTGPEDIYSGRENGTYSFEIKQEGEAQILFIESIREGELLFTDGSLTIEDKMLSDGFIKTYQK